MSGPNQLAKPFLFPDLLLLHAVFCTNLACMRTRTACTNNLAHHTYTYSRTCTNAINAAKQTPRPRVQPGPEAPRSRLPLRRRMQRLMAPRISSHWPSNIGIRNDAIMVRRSAVLCWLAASRAARRLLFYASWTADATSQSPQLPWSTRELTLSSVLYLRVLPTSLRYSCLLPLLDRSTVRLTSQQRLQVRAKGSQRRCRQRRGAHLGAGRWHLSGQPG